MYTGEVQHDGQGHGYGTILEKSNEYGMQIVNTRISFRGASTGLGKFGYPHLTIDFSQRSLQ